MVLKVPKNSPSLVDLKETARRKRYLFSKKNYIVAYDEIAAYKRRERTGYEDFVNKITSVMLEEFVDYLKKENCAKKIAMESEKCSLSDIAETSLVSPAASVSVIDDDASLNLSSLSEEEYQIIENQKDKICEMKKSTSSYKTPPLGEPVVKDKNEIKQTSGEPRRKSSVIPKKNSIYMAGPKIKVASEPKLTEGKEESSSKTVVEEGGDKKTPEDKKKSDDEPTPKPKIFDSHDINVDVLFKNGNRYQGRLSCYMMEGEATYSWSDGTTYKGTFKDGIAEGLGLITWPDGSWFDGEIKRNRRHGKGVSVYKIDGQPRMCYFGNWKNGRTNGKGMIIYGERNWYDGYWKDGIHNGFGLRQYPSGSQYLGEWKNGQEHGWGTMMWYNRDVYTGYWNKGTMEGRGTYVWRCVKGDGFVHPMQNTYIGNWKNGLRHGNGSLLLANGAMIHAVWVNGIKEGPGQIICKNGLVIQSSYLFKVDKVYKLDCPIMIPFWNTWYCHFLSSYRTGLFYIQELEDNLEESEKNNIPQETNEKCNVCSNNIPIVAPIESLPLWDVIMKTVCQPIPDLTGEISYIIRPEDVELLSTEEMWLRKVISNRISDITCLYQHYATIACEKKPLFKACMFRIMLWQMCRDCGLDQTSLSLCDLDRETGCDSYPFAIVLVFQMIHYLLILAYELCVKKRLANKSIPGKWGGAFDYFLTNYALPGMQKTNQISEMCNTMPLRNVLSMYEDIGNPVTIGKILQYFLSDKFIDLNKPKNKIGYQIYGQNKVYPDGRIIFEEAGGTLLGTVFDFQDPNAKYLGFNEIKLIGKRELALTLFNICPKAKLGNIPKHNHEVSFLEFCEFMKTCLKKYNAIIDPNTEVLLIKKMAKCDSCNRYVEIERRYKMEHKSQIANEEENQTSSSSSDTSTKTDKSADSENQAGSHDEGTDDNLVQDIRESDRKTYSKSNGEFCPCKTSELVSVKESSAEKICKCEKTCECSCNIRNEPDDSESFEIIEENDSTSSESNNVAKPFKDAKAVIITACDSDCHCFCHEGPEPNPDKEKLKDSRFGPGALDKLHWNKDLDTGTMSSVKISDAINYLCGIINEEEETVEEDGYEMNANDFSEEESSSDVSSDDSDYELEQLRDEYGEELSSEDDNILAGEDFIENTKNFLLELDKIKNSKSKKDMKQVYEKLLQYKCPLFKINYNEFFKKINTKGMTPEQIRKGLDLEGSDDVFEEQEVEDIEKELIDESLKVIKLVAEQRLYEKLLLDQFRRTISQTETGEYWENFVKSNYCNCFCKNCLAGECAKKEKMKLVVKDMEYEISSDSSVSIG